MANDLVGAIFQAALKNRAQGLPTDYKGTMAAPPGAAAPPPGLPVNKLAMAMGGVASGDPQTLKPQAQQFKQFILQTAKQHKTQVSKKWLTQDRPEKTDPKYEGSMWQLKDLCFEYGSQLGLQGPEINDIFFAALREMGY